MRSSGGTRGLSVMNGLRKKGGIDELLDGGRGSSRDERDGRGEICNGGLDVTPVDLTSPNKVSSGSHAGHVVLKLPEELNVPNLLAVSFDEFDNCRLQTCKQSVNRKRKTLPVPERDVFHPSGVVRGWPYQLPRPMRVSRFRTAQ